MRAVFVAPTVRPGIARGGASEASEAPGAMRERIGAPTGRPDVAGSPRWGYRVVGAGFQGLRCAPPLAIPGRPLGARKPRAAPRQSLPGVFTRNSLRANHSADSTDTTSPPPSSTRTQSADDGNL